MTNQIKIFESPEFGRIRTVSDEKGEPWFIGKDVATVKYTSMATMSWRSTLVMR